MSGRIVKLTYRFVPEFYYKRIPSHQAHIDYFRALSARGVQVLGGSTFPYGGAQIFLRGLNAPAAEQLARGDPFFTSGLVQDFAVKAMDELEPGSADPAFRAFAYICK